MLLHNIFITSKSNSIYIYIFKNTKKEKLSLISLTVLVIKNRYLQQKIEAILIAVANLIYD
ncbi:uncharacterized protein KNN_03256 [Bacillus thuringiensis serovar tolworthi]|uniref:Uncharacterized protein n=1 Tax=Bacillus thuringiensis subsp. tolworthi TaxID=1442 RepID=A0A9W4EUC6_BACTO|nr:uncharacterized protein KNN_03256 [Bacillus thuringiensis serovar tolworthi]